MSGIIIVLSSSSVTTFKIRQFKTYRLCKNTIRSSFRVYASISFHPFWTFDHFRPIWLTWLFIFTKSLGDLCREDNELVIRMIKKQFPRVHIFRSKNVSIIWNGLRTLTHHVMKSLCWNDHKIMPHPGRIIDNELEIAGGEEEPPTPNTHSGVGFWQHHYWPPCTCEVRQFDNLCQSPLQYQQTPDYYKAFHQPSVKYLGLSLF